MFPLSTRPFSFVCTDHNVHWPLEAASTPLLAGDVLGYPLGDSTCCRVYSMSPVSVQVSMCTYGVRIIGSSVSFHLSRNSSDLQAKVHFVRISLFPCGFCSIHFLAPMNI
jgi:hypothetical protein